MNYQEAKPYYIKTVCDILTNALIEVPVTFIQCNNCLEYNSQTVIVNSICPRCENNLESRKIQKEQRHDFFTLQNDLLDKKKLDERSVNVSDMIEALQLLPLNSKLYIKQDGYYADGNYAECYLPKPEFTKDGIQYFEIGYSEQSV